jgi:hypothetical protein
VGQRLRGAHSQQDREEERLGRAPQRSPRRQRVGWGRPPGKLAGSSTKRLRAKPAIRRFMFMGPSQRLGQNREIGRPSVVESTVRSLGGRRAERRRASDPWHERNPRWCDLQAGPAHGVRMRGAVGSCQSALPERENGREMDHRLCQSGRLAVEPRASYGCNRHQH